MPRGAVKLARTTKLRAVGARARRGRAELKRNRETVLEAAAGLCARCGKRRDLEVHHVKPRSRTERGENPHAVSNLRALCAGPRGCHALVTAHLVDDWMDWIVTRKGARHAG